LLEKGFKTLKRVRFSPAKTQKVAVLSGNFCRELSVPETGEGVLAPFVLSIKPWNARSRVPSGTEKRRGAVLAQNSENVRK